MTATLIYKGNLRCEATHLQSGSQLQTDAPTDNKGKGEKFSPTDLLCVSLATCILTTMAIKADSMGVALEDGEHEIIKTMQASPRLISRIQIKLNLPAGISEEDRFILEKVGNNCPVAKSLNADMDIDITYEWQ
jgi:uncharacterized OsmC-like protein